MLPQLWNLSNVILQQRDVSPAQNTILAMYITILSMVNKTVPFLDIHNHITLDSLVSIFLSYPSYSTIIRHSKKIQRLPQLNNIFHHRLKVLALLNTISFIGNWRKVPLSLKNLQVQFKIKFEKPLGYILLLMIKMKVEN